MRRINFISSGADFRSATEANAANQLPFTHSGTTSFVRPLGAHEQQLYELLKTRPMHFTLAAELVGEVEPERLRCALRAVQHRHKLLSAQVEVHSGGRAGFYVPSSVPPVPLAVLNATAERTWQQVAEQELRTGFDPAQAPLLRATLFRESPQAATLLLSFALVIADGRSATFVLNDILTVLNGQQLAVLPVPLAQEALLTRLYPLLTPATDERLRTARSAISISSVPRPISTITFTEELTSRLLDNCHAEGTTLHAALVAACSRLHCADTGQLGVQVLTPFSLRELLKVGHECADYSGATRTTCTPLQTQNFWELARITGADIALARTTASTPVPGGATATPDLPDSSLAATETAQSGRRNIELMISNLGVVELTTPGSICLAAVWGPLLPGLPPDRYALGASTLQGCLRLSSASYSLVFLECVRAALATACKPSH